MNIDIARHPLAFAGAVLAIAAGTQAALAAPPELPSQGGLLMLPNVKVEMAAQTVDGKSGSSRELGMKAYKDRETGALRKQSPEEMIEEAAASPRANNAAGARVTVSSTGRKSAALDESFMSYAVVRKADDGSIDMQCVTGESQARAALKGTVVVKEHRHAQ
jgi:hypothetical protein